MSELFFIIYQWLDSEDKLKANEFKVSETYDVQSFGHLFLSKFTKLICFSVKYFNTKKKFISK